jgi:hypothetical protein
MRQVESVIKSARRQDHAPDVWKRPQRFDGGARSRKSTVEAPEPAP